MKKLSYSELEAQFMELLPGGEKAICTDSTSIERMQYQWNDFLWSELSADDSLYMVKRKRVSVRKLVFQFLSDVTPLRMRLPLPEAQLKAVRTHVCDFNKRTGKAVKVMVENGHIVVREDIEGREKITEDEFRYYEAYMNTQIEVMRRRIITV